VRESCLLLLTLDILVNYVSIYAAQPRLFMNAFSDSMYQFCLSVCMFVAPKQSSIVSVSLNTSLNVFALNLIIQSTVLLNKNLPPINYCTRRCTIHTCMLCHLYFPSSCCQSANQNWLIEYCVYKLIKAACFSRLGRLFS